MIGLGFGSNRAFEVDVSNNNFKRSEFFGCYIYSLPTPPLNKPSLTIAKQSFENKIAGTSKNWGRLFLICPSYLSREDTEISRK